MPWAWTSMKWITASLVLEVVFLQYASCQCNWPTGLQSSIWLDSDKGHVTFTTSSLSGLGFSAQGGDAFDTWDCFLRADYTATSGHTVLIMKSTSTFMIFESVYVPFLCMQLTEISADSFYYYMLGYEEVRVNYERLSVRELSVADNLTSANAEANLCITGNVTVNEYHLLVKDASEVAASQTCPTLLQDEFWYYVNVSDVITCNTQTELWDSCSDSTTMMLDYTKCSTTIAYSSTGSVRCMFSLASGSNTLVTVWNNDGTVSPPSTYRFTCFLATTDEAGSVVMSQSPGSCTRGQTPHDLPVHPDGTTGSNLVLTPHAISACDPTTTTTTTTPSTTSTTTTTTSTTTSTTSTTTTTSPTTTTTPDPTTTTTTTEATTTTTTSPTTTTTEPTTTISTLTTTTTEEPTTTTTTPQTTTTAMPTTTTPTVTTTADPTTTTMPTTTTTTTKAATAAPESSDDNTIALIAAIVGGVAIVLVLALLVGLLVYKRCRSKRPVISVKPQSSPEPDLILESLPHKTAGYGGIRPNLLMGPRETSLLDTSRPHTELHVFPHAKCNNFKLTLPPPILTHGAHKPPLTNHSSYLLQRSSTNISLRGESGQKLTRSTSFLTPRFNTISENKASVDNEIDSVNSLPASQRQPADFQESSGPDSRVSGLNGRIPSLSPIPVESPDSVSKSYVPDNAKPIHISQNQERTLNSRIISTSVSPKNVGDEITESITDRIGTVNNTSTVSSGNTDSQHLFTTFNLSPTRPPHHSHDLVISKTPDSLSESGKISGFTRVSELDVTLPSEIVPEDQAQMELLNYGQHDNFNQLARSAEAFSPTISESGVESRESPQSTIHVTPLELINL